MKNELNKLNLEKHRLHENFHNCSYKSIVNEKEDCVIFMRKKLLFIGYRFGRKFIFAFCKMVSLSSLIFIILNKITFFKIKFISLAYQM